MGKGWKSGIRGGKLVKPVKFQDLRVSSAAVTQPDEVHGVASSGAGGSHNDQIDKYALYQSAVQAPQGDITYMLRFFRQYIGLQVPLHLREDFCGTAFLATTWCKGDVRRSAVGVDIDGEAMEWGLRTNADAMLGGSTESQLCLLQSNVLDDISSAPRVRCNAAVEAGPGVSTPSEGPPATAADANATEARNNPQQQQQHQGNADVAQDAEDADEEVEEADLRHRRADIVCALNFGLCLLHTREQALQYLRHARASMQGESGSIMVLDMLGGCAAESDARIERTNAVTGAAFLWEQEAFSPVNRHIYAHISLKRQGAVVLPRVWNYHWRLWTIPEARELLLAAGFDAVHVWLRPMRQTGDVSPGSNKKNLQDEEEEEEQDFREVPLDKPLFRADDMAKINRGWTGYVIGVVLPRDE